MKTIHQQLKGIVVAKPSETMVVVECTRFIQHPKYRKFFKRIRRYHAHDAANVCVEGDTVIIEAARARSKTKRWRIAAKA